MAMTAILDMTVYGDPVAKGRPRMGPSGHAFTPERTRSAERALVAQLQTAMAGKLPSSGSIGMAVEFYCATKRKTDGDNLLKLVTDAMNEVVFVDDSQVLEWFVRVKRGVGKKDARTELFVWERDEPADA